MFAGVLTLLVAASPGVVFVDAAQANAMVKAGAVVLDARDDPEPPYLVRAQPLEWMSLRDGIGRTGKLADTAKLVDALRRVGIDNDRAVLVYGAGRDGWGEEARIWWMLRYLGHEDVRILDGGIYMWRMARFTTSKSFAKPDRIGNFTPKIESALRADADRVNRTRKMPFGQILDVRTLEEFNGATPYWSFRGGHIPGAKRAPWRAFLDEDGRALPAARLKRMLKDLGLVEDRPTITYCTAGVRSAFVTALLIEAGFEDVANYDGSWWEWSSRTELPVQTATKK